VAKIPQSLNPSIPQPELRLKSKSGFTLVEMAIVLVIVGLIIGGVMAGSELIRVSKVSRTVKEITEYETAMTLFFNKYDAIPGDFSKASTFFGGADGNQNGMLDNNEGYTTFYNLSKANFIKGSFANGYNGQPNGSKPWRALPGLTINDNYAMLPTYEDPAGQGVGSYYYNPLELAGNFFEIGWDNNTYWVQPGVFTQDMIDLDNKIDDGLPMTGFLFASYAHTACISAYCSTPSTCAAIVYQPYNSTGQFCKLSYRLSKYLQ